MTTKLNKLLFNSITTILLTVSISSCATIASGPQFVKQPIADTSKARIYIYRPYLYCWGARKPDLYIDGTMYLEIENQGYTQLYINPGIHEFEARGMGDMPSVSLTINAEAGKYHYLKYDMNCRADIFNTYFGPIRFTQVDEEVALPEVSKCKYIKTKQK